MHEASCALLALACAFQFGKDHTGRYLEHAGDLNQRVVSFFSQFKNTGVVELVIQVLTMLLEGQTTR